MPGDLFETIIPRAMRLAEAPSYGQVISEYDPDSRGAAAYEQLADEVLARLGWPERRYENDTEASAEMVAATIGSPTSSVTTPLIAPYFQMRISTSLRSSSGPRSRTRAAPLGFFFR